MPNFRIEGLKKNCLLLLHSLRRLWELTLSVAGKIIKDIQENGFFFTLFLFLGTANIVTVQIRELVVI